MIPVPRHISLSAFPLGIVVLLWTILPTRLHAQRTPPTEIRIGPVVEYGLGTVRAEQAPQIYGLSSGCGTFDPTGTGEMFGVGIESRISFGHERRFGLRGGLLYRRTHGFFTGAPLDEQRVFDETSGELVLIEREFRQEYVSGSIALDMLGEYRVWNSIRVGAGLSTGLRLQTSFTETDNVVGPDDRSFEDGQRSRVVEEGPEYAAGSFSFGPVISLEFGIPMFRTARLTPRISVAADILSPAQDQGWTSYRATVGVGLGFDRSPKPAPPTIPPASPEPPPPPPIPLPSATVTIVGLDEDGSESEATRITATRTLLERRLPLLPTIYFEHDAADLPERYAPGTGTDDPAQRVADGSLVDVNHNLLEFMRERLAAHPELSVEIIGSFSSNENPALRQQREERIREQMGAAGIEGERIQIAPDLPERADERTEDGREENRRVQIVTPSPAIIGPVLISDTLNEFTPPLIRISPTYEAAAGVARWEITILHNGEVKSRYTSEQSAAGESPKFDWRISTDPGVRSLAPIVARFLLVDSLGRESVGYDTVEIELENVDTRVNADVERAFDRERRTSWILGFGYDSYEIIPRQDQELRRIAEGIRDGAVVTITGYTDLIGKDDYNDALSLRRAESVANRLRRLLEARGVSSYTINPIGGGVDRETFDNTLPEGRALSRSVQVTVEQSAIN